MDRPLIVILGAGRPYRGEEPSALVRTPGGQRVLDWILHAFSRLADAELIFIGGYGIDEVLRQYPEVRCFVNPEWRGTGSLGSLLAAPLEPSRTTYVCYADVVFDGGVVELLSRAAGDVVIAVDRRWRTRYEERTADDLRRAEKVRLHAGGVREVGSEIPVDRADAEFIGLTRLGPRAVAATLDLAREDHPRLARAGLPTLITALQSRGYSVGIVDVQGRWAELNAPQDLARFVLGTKASTLERLRPLVRCSVIGELITFTAGEWRQESHQVLDRIYAAFGRRSLAVRSSACHEDTFKESQAGRFATVLDVPGGDRERLAAAIERVVASYGDSDPQHQVLVQPFLDQVRASGVVFTRTLGYGGPYYTISIDEAPDATDRVTGGRPARARTVILHRDHAEVEAGRLDTTLPQIVAAVRELEALAGHDALDVEFAQTPDGMLHVLQLRPLVITHLAGQLSDRTVAQALNEAIEAFAARRRPVPPLVGHLSVFAVMPDWNPAEIIGIRPRPLALSLYQFLITNETWAIQRAQYGYRDVRPAPLVVTFCGHPYVDVRASFNSFVPAPLGDETAARLVDAWLQRLLAQPALHDKVEFEVAITCLTSDFDRRAEPLREAGLTAEEVRQLREALRVITAHAFGRGRAELAEIARLEALLPAASDPSLPPIPRAALLLDQCKQRGCLPFAHLARSAFVATALLRAFEADGVIDTDVLQRFLGSIRTVAREFEADGAAVAAGQLAWDAFVARYGHLRPGTYEITTPSYAEEPERFLRPMVRATTPPPDPAPLTPTASAARRLADGLARLGLPNDVQAFERFVVDAIRGRERAKFAFTRHLDAALRAIAEFGRLHGFTRDDLSYVRVTDLLLLRTGEPTGGTTAWLARRIDEGRTAHRIAEQVELPPILADVQDFHGFVRPRSEPNYITRRQAIGPVCALAHKENRVGTLRGAIVALPQADPGFDWLFGHGIAGLVTAYGGANSHMAIRAAEFNVPAVVGLGEDLYERVARAELVEIDCAARRLTIIR